MVKMERQKVMKDYLISRGIKKDLAKKYSSKNFEKFKSEVDKDFKFKKL